MQMRPLIILILNVAENYPFILSYYQNKHQKMNRRGYTISQVRIEENCQCKYVHCCYIKCKKCLTTLSKYFCK
ncbi:Protein Wnt [Meloidogyne graminicola]|uniref:Protein Wnt n=1 Tax=Meloidogyne graminicola TaxID=189291 RepID=A0A8S9ZVI7_9BILA|nr:Protein Wnt [Meloidogyne graminicola]